MLTTDVILSLPQTPSYISSRMLNAGTSIPPLRKRVTTKRSFDFKLTSDLDKDEKSKGEQRTGSVEVIISPPARVISSNSSKPLEDILRDSPVPVILNSHNGAQYSHGSNHTRSSAEKDVFSEENNACDDDSDEPNEMAENPEVSEKRIDKSPQAASSQDENERHKNVQRKNKYTKKDSIVEDVKKNTLKKRDKSTKPDLEPNCETSNIYTENEELDGMRDKQMPLNFTAFFEKQHGKGPLTSTPCVPKKAAKRKIKFSQNASNARPSAGEQGTKKKKKKRETSDGLVVRFWNGMNEKERRIGDVIDLDVILDCILKTLQGVIDAQESYLCEQAVKELMDFLVKGIVDSIEKIQKTKLCKQKINKIKRKINCSRKQLLQVQQRNSELEMEIQDINQHRKEERDKREISTWLNKLQDIGNKTSIRNQLPDKDSQVITTFGYVPDIG